MHTIARSATGLSGLHCSLTLESSLSGRLHEVPELESGEWTVVETGPFSWQTNASRQVENFTDFGHFRGFILASWVILTVRRFRST